MAKAKTEPKLTLPALTAWLKKQDPKAKYDFCDNENCLIAQFVKSQGFRKVSVIPWSVSFGSRSVELSSQLNIIAMSNPNSFGDALKRAQRQATR